MKSKPRQNVGITQLAKENCPVSGNCPNKTSSHQFKNIINNSLRNYDYQNQKPLSFQEVRRICMKQEKQVLCQVKNHSLEQNFYEFCQTELQGLHILDEIERIRNLSNQDAITEFHQNWNKKFHERQNYMKEQQNEDELNIFPQMAAHKFSIMEEEEPQLPQISHADYHNYEEMESDSRQWDGYPQQQQFQGHYPIFTQNDIFEF